MSSSASSSVVAAVSSDAEDDACSICLEPFDSHDPPTETNCKHEYHLQCILEWSQRSKECPICWQILGLKDPTSQELLAAIEIERNTRSSSNVRCFNEDQEISNASHMDAPHIDYSDFEERVMRHFVAATSRMRNASRRRRQTSGIGPARVLPSFPETDAVNVQQTNNSPEECPNLSHQMGVGLPISTTSSRTMEPTSSSVFPVASATFDSAVYRDSSFMPSQHQPNSPQRSGSSDFVNFSESIKSKLSAASARYKESISKSTRGFKEKLLARNNTVKELSREVQREMSACIAGVTRMIERVDIAPKRTEPSAGFRGCTVDPSNFVHKGKNVHETVSTQMLAGNSGESQETDNSRSSSSQLPSCVDQKITLPRVENDVINVGNGAQ